MTQSSKSVEEVVVEDRVQDARNGSVRKSRPCENRTIEFAFKMTQQWIRAEHHATRSESTESKNRTIAHEAEHNNVERPRGPREEKNKEDHKEICQELRGSNQSIKNSMKTHRKEKSIGDDKIRKPKKEPESDRTDQTHRRVHV